MTKAFECIRFVLVIFSLGCSSTPAMRPALPNAIPPDSPLGQYSLIPFPGDDDSLLGRVIAELPSGGQTLDQVSRPNECEADLARASITETRGRFEHAEELASSGSAKASLGNFGFSAEADAATHFYYKLETRRRAKRMDTVAYRQCCKAKGSCGYGYVSELIYADGMYAAAAETRGEAGVVLPIAATVGGSVNARILRSREVHGYVGALIMIMGSDDRDSHASTEHFGVLGDKGALKPPVQRESLPLQVQARFAAQQISIADLNNANAISPSRVEFNYAFRDGSGPISESEFLDRYSSLVGPRDVLGLEAPSNSGKVLATALSFGIGTPALVWGIARADSGHCPTDETNTAHCDALTYTLALGGLLGTMVGASYLLFGLEPGVDQHNMSRYDAQLFIERYNRALWQQTVDETRERMDRMRSSLRRELRVVVAPTFTGVVGTF